jgi:transketolase
MTAISKSSHIGSCFSIVDALAVLYFKVMRHDPKKPKLESRDIFILSKAHGSAALYAVLAESGYFDVNILDRFYVDDGVLPGHLDQLAVPGVETSGGSLGHGLSLAIGMALSRKRLEQPSRVFVLVGDGECNEGSIWEGAMLAPQLQLGNLTVLIDYNKIQGLGNTDEILNQKNMVDRWSAFGWEACEIDGHDYSDLEKALKSPSEKPKAVILHTIKGKGVSFMEGQLAWHYRSPGPKELEAALKELE